MTLYVAFPGLYVLPGRTFIHWIGHSMDSLDFCFLLRRPIVLLFFDSTTGIGGNYVILCHDFDYDSLFPSTLILDDRL